MRSTHQRDFVAVVSHQFRTPVQIIDGARNVLERKAEKYGILEEEQNVLLLGNRAKYNDITEYAFLTDSAQFIQFSSVQQFVPQDQIPTTCH